MSRVFIISNQHQLDRRTQELVPKFDFSSAARYGKLEFLLSPNANPLGPGLRDIVAQLHEKLSTFTPDDHLILVGNPCLIGMATAIAANYSGGVVNMLQWSGRDERYVPVAVDLSNP